MNLFNWAGNYSYHAEELQQPKSVAQLQEVVAHAQKCKALGTRHSFNEIADSPGELISTAHLQNIVSLNRDLGLVKIQGGLKYGHLADYLQSQGFALRNMASLPHISVAGACVTGTHGSGVALQNLSCAVTELELVIADGSIVKFSRDEGGDFAGAVVNLGAIGVIADLTLEVVPSFQVAQKVYVGLPVSATQNHLEDILSSGYSVSLFTHWDSEFFHQVWIKRLSDGPDSEWPTDFFGARAATAPTHMITTMPAENCTTQMGEPGPWHHRLPHFKMEFTPSGGEELQSEYFVPRSLGVQAIQAVKSLSEKIAPLIYVTEIRSVAADILWMSPAFERNCLAIHFTWRQMTPEVTELLPEIEAALAPFDPRPHPGKIFRMPSDKLQAAFPKYSEFKSLVEKYDPLGKFQNDYLQKHFDL